MANALFRFPMRRVLAAPAAVLLQFEPIGVVSLVLIRRVVPPFALLAREVDNDADVAATLFRHVSNSCPSGREALSGQPSARSLMAEN